MKRPAKSALLCGLAFLVGAATGCPTATPVSTRNDVTVPDVAVKDLPPPDVPPETDSSVPAPIYRFVDFHAHCNPLEPSCNGKPVESLLGGEVLVVAAALEHYSIAEALGDPVPSELSNLTNSNDITRAGAESSSQVVYFASLDCLNDTAASVPNFTDKCLADADKWLAAGAAGFKDHAGKTFDGDDLDLGRWVGAYNRLAGWCTPMLDSPSPNRECLAQPGVQMPLARPEWRAMVKGIVQDRGVPLLTHAAPWYGGFELCPDSSGALKNCHDVAADALVDFAQWARDTLPLEARRRIVIAHFGFLQENESRWRAVLDAGLTMDLAQTPLSRAGCNLRTVVADYPDQLVIGTDLHVGDACVQASYEAWSYAFTGPMGVSKAFPNTCRGTMEPVGAELGTPEPGSCGIAVPVGAGERLMWGNALKLLGMASTF